MSKWPILLCLMLSFSVSAQTADALMREEWVRELKTLLASIEKKDPSLLVENENQFLKSFSLISSAWADSRFNCFYGGWPSVLRSSGGKKLCQLPSNTNPNYNSGACGKSEIQCQPILFNKGHCVPFSTAEERRSSYSNCEKKFQASGGNYSYLNNPSESELLELQEISMVAGEVCGPKSDSPQKDTIICKNIMKKLPDGMKSIQKGIVRATASVESDPVVELAKPAPAPVSVQAPEPVVSVVTASVHKEEDCDEPSHSHNEVKAFAEQMSQVAVTSVDQMYLAMKEKFQNSPFCKPENVMNDPGKQPSGMLIRILDREIRGLEYNSNLDTFISRYQLNSSSESSIRSYISQIKNNSGDVKALRAKMKATVFQDVLNNKQLDMSGFRTEIAADLVKAKVFKTGDDGQAECPFVSKDAFLKAMKGRDAVIAKHRGRVKLPDQMTIVDYSRPSNERRMYVLDLNNMDVLHNTWVAHGIGSADDGGGSDGYGSNPEISNVSGSLKSSDGFIIAGPASSGNMFGNNVILNGIDRNNGNMAARAVVMHEWITPMEGYSMGSREWDRKKKRFTSPVDTVQKLKNLNLSTASTKQIEDAVYGMTDETYLSKYMATTEGCLGVSGAVMKHLDKKGRNIKQIEMFRQDLPGSIIFNYSGPDMKSNFF